MLAVGLRNQAHERIQGAVTAAGGRAEQCAIAAATAHLGRARKPHRLLMARRLSRADERIRSATATADG